MIFLVIWATLDGLVFCDEGSPAYVFFAVVARPPGQVRPADVLAFITAQRTGRAGEHGVLQSLKPGDEPDGVSAATVRRRARDERADEPAGLRARKKARTRDAIADAAISLFLARGFDQVSVADIAAAAEVSKPTLFRYFTAKEDLVLHRIADHNGEAARVVRDRPPGVSPLTALHQHFRAGLDCRDPVTGLNDHPVVLAFHRLVFTTPSLAGRLVQYALDNEETLAAALGGDVTARLQAAQVIAVQRVLARTTWQKLVTGKPPTTSIPRPSRTPTGPSRF